MKNGLTSSGDDGRAASVASSALARPPTQEPTITAARSGSPGAPESPASRIAISAAAMANC